MPAVWGVVQAIHLIKSQLAQRGIDVVIRIAVACCANPDVLDELLSILDAAAEQGQAGRVLERQVRPGSVGSPGLRHRIQRQEIHQCSTLVVYKCSWQIQLIRYPIGICDAPDTVDGDCVKGAATLYFKL